MSDQLRAQGIELIEGFDAEQLALTARPVRRSATSVSRGNPLMEEILDAGAAYIPARSGSPSTCCAGSAGGGRHPRQDHDHVDAGVDPGARRPRSGLPDRRRADELRHFRARCARGSPFFVIEADEYDTAFFDKRCKFVHYRPRTAILNNLEFDHADIFPDLAAIETQFHHLVRTMPGKRPDRRQRRAKQRCSACWQRGCWSEVERFGAQQRGAGPLRARDERMPSTCFAAGRKSAA